MEKHPWFMGITFAQKLNSHESPERVCQ